ncbi:MAG: hypothetical protein R3261_02700 [Alphaproteobacteria bacterium]|nr:hypothetical protein [Alphaproteobacteria bacterium]
MKTENRPEIIHPDTQSRLKLQIQGYRLATAEILYRMPDHQTILQSFIWQTYDLKPEYPEIHKFIEFWEKNIDGPLHSVRIDCCDIITPGNTRFADHLYELH